MALALKDVSVDPLTGILDLRSNPDQIPKDGMRWRQNFMTVSGNKLRRAPGWTKLLDQSPYNNQDFHDQLLAITGGVRQPITLAFEAISTNRVRSLIIGNEGMLAKLNESTGNWHVLGSGFGAGGITANGPRFKAAILGDYVVVTNDYDPPMYYVLESSESAGPLLNVLPDFSQDVLNVTRAKLVWEWKNVIFFANYEEDGTRVANGIIWSDYQNPISFDPSVTSSITGKQLLQDNEEILGGAPLGNSFLIYTNLGIWEMDVVGGQQSFGFTRIYPGDKNNRKGCLFYPNSLVDLGDYHLYLGSDGLYLFNQYNMRPDRPEWLHRASSFITDTIDTHACEAHISQYSGDNVYVSFTETGTTNLCPTKTLRINVPYKACDTIDAGFTALVNYHSYPVETVRDFIIDNAICTLDQMRLAGYGFQNEGLPLPVPNPPPAFVPQHIYTSWPLTVAGATTEDYNQPFATPDSLCALLNGRTLDSICRTCQPVKIFVGASSQDWCLKSLNTAFYRERCTNPTAVGSSGVEGYQSSTGQYLLDGYDSILRPAPAWAKNANVAAKRLWLAYMAAAQNPASKITLRVGLSGQVADPNTDTCNLVWHQLSAKDLKCLGKLSMEQYLAGNVTPSLPLQWTFQYEAAYLYFELKISGVGGDSYFSGLHADMDEKVINNR